MSRPLTEEVSTGSYPKPPHSFEQVMKAWTTKPGKPSLVFCAHAGQEQKWDWNFTLSYEVVLDGWRYIVQAHVHEYHDGTQVPGNSFVPGFKNKSLRTPEFVVDQAPQFDKKVHAHGWSSDSDYQSTLYKGDYRYPTKL